MSSPAGSSVSLKSTGSTSKAKIATLSAIDALNKTIFRVQDENDELTSLNLKNAVEMLLEAINVVEKTRVEAKYIIELDAYLKQLMEFVIKPLQGAQLTAELTARIDYLAIDLTCDRRTSSESDSKNWLNLLIPGRDSTASIVRLSDMLSKALNSFLHGHIIYNKPRREIIRARGANTQIRTEPAQKLVLPTIYIETVETTPTDKQAPHFWDQVKFMRRKL